MSKTRSRQGQRVTRHTIPWTRPVVNPYTGSACRSARVYLTSDGEAYNPAGGYYSGPCLITYTLYPDGTIQAYPTYP